ncbi:hypothetical protein PYCCODRAFT_806133 [Trametes coccinea BRFM310]|uniref:Uncharacterized protein n=1 Tax=Trametes coccinea (strain BRFM310) TaxID=1353009 RepID=A0A1Y2IEY9_TRAC3|nr:hypothetical protein PYCCODRAFT_806133 [Trametes coccinea BRFM310]
MSYGSIIRLRLTDLNSLLQQELTSSVEVDNARVGLHERRAIATRGLSDNWKRMNANKVNTSRPKLPSTSRFAPNTLHTSTIPAQPLEAQGATNRNSVSIPNHRPASLQVLPADAQATPSVGTPAVFQSAARPAELSSVPLTDDPISITLPVTTRYTPPATADRPSKSSTPEDPGSDDAEDDDADADLVHTLLTIIAVESVVIFLLLVALIWLFVVLRRRRQVHFVQLQEESSTTPKPADAPTPADEVPFIEKRGDPPSRHSSVSSISRYSQLNC